MSKKIYVLMSGGVDSSVSAFLLLQQGFNITGVTLKLFDSKSSENAIADAKKVCEVLNIEHTVLDLKSEFKNKVIDYFINEYCSGRTPNPCVVCNKDIKFGMAIEKLNAKHIATGHYSKVVKINGRYSVEKTKNLKDQSYCFCMLNQSQLEKIVTPVHEFQKDKIRQIAKDNNIPVWCKKDSQDICFIKTTYRDFLCKNGIKSNPGEFIDEEGNILGYHTGIFNYTVGQRKGLNISSESRLYVKKIDFSSNKIILSKKNAIKKIKIENLNFVLFTKENLPSSLMVCVRYSNSAVNAKIEILENHAVLDFDFPIFNVCPGQFAVCYYENFIALSGVISEIL